MVQAQTDVSAYDCAVLAPRVTLHLHGCPLLRSSRAFSLLNQVDLRSCYQQKLTWLAYNKLNEMSWQCDFPLTDVIQISF